MVTAELIIRTVLTVFSALAFAHLAISSRKPQYIILEVQCFILLVARATVVFGMSNTLSEILLTSATVTTTILAIYCIYDDYRLKYTLEEIRAALKRREENTQ